MATEKLQSSGKDSMLVTRREEPRHQRGPGISCYGFLFLVAG